MTPDGLASLWGRYGFRVTSIVAGWAALTGLLVAAGVAVVHSGAVNAFDHRVTMTVVGHRSPALNAAMKVMTWLGSWVAAGVTACVLLALAARRFLPWSAVFVAVVGWIGEAGGVAIAKHVVGRQRPPENIRLVSARGWSWPSGHTGTAVLLFTVLAATVTYIGRPATTLVVAWLTAILAVAVVAFSRVELGVHWSSDVIAAAIFVIAWLAVLFLAIGPPVRSGAALSFHERARKGSNPTSTDGPHPK
jgi:membrane-associated phospholipid phosphatase